MEEMGEIHVKKSFSCTGARFDITWIRNGGNKPQFEIDISMLVGNQVTGHVQTIQDGGIIYGPLSGEFLQLAKSNSQVLLAFSSSGFLNKLFITYIVGAD